MIYVDKYAYFSGLKETSPLLKILFGGLSLTTCVCSWSFLSFAIVFVAMLFMTIVKGRIPVGYYVKLLALPLGFLLFGVIGVVVNITSTPLPPESVGSLSVGRYTVFVSNTGLQTAAMLVCKSMAAVSCLYFIILTTPFRDIVRFMEKFRCPNIIVTLSILIYQYIFLLLDIADIKLKSQLCRGGFRSLKRFPRDFAMLWGSVFVQAWFKSRWTFKSMQSRGYDGRLMLMPKKDRLRLHEAILLLAFLAMVIAPNYMSRF